MGILFNYPLSVIFVASVIALSVASEIGHYLGLRASAEALWRQAKAAMAKDNAMAPTGLYIQP